MILMQILFLSICVGGIRANFDVTDEEYYRFPPLFHLDDYESCLRRPGGLYCMGDFQLSAVGRNPTFDLMKIYSEDTNNYNRTIIHRGYCVSQRCPAPRSTSPSPLAAADRFARCVSVYAERNGLQTKLQRLTYCKTHKEYISKTRKVETPHRVFLWVLAVILLMNVIGTVYDVRSNGKKNKLLTSFSVANNWQYLAGPFPSGDPRLAALLPVEGGRVIVLLFSIVVHCWVSHILLYLQNPRVMEKMGFMPMMFFLKNSSSMIQMFFLLSSFFLAQGMLREELSFRKLPAILMKRYLRLAPVHILSVGFAATWWPFFRDGPQWDPIVGSESAICRNKFWAHVFFVGNFVKDEDFCLLPSWYLGVEVQLYLLSAVLTVVLAKCRSPLKVLASLFIITNLANFWITYTYEMSSTMQYWGVQNVRKIGTVVSCRYFYIKPWSNLPCALVGIFMAYLLHQLKGFNPQNHKLLILLCQLCMPLIPISSLFAGSMFHSLTGWRAALYAALERPFFSVMVALVLFGILNGNGRKIESSKKNDDKPTGVKVMHNGYLHRLFSWRGLYPLGRMTLAVMMMHWCVLMVFVASRPGLYNTSQLDTIVDFAATTVFSYILAVPVTLLLDIPVQQLIKAFS